MKTKGGISHRTANRRARSAFTLVELLVVVAIMMLAVGALLPALGGFFDSARLPDARNLISAHLAGARNYAVANTVTTALVFTEDTSESKRRVLMYLARHATGTSFTVVAGRQTTYLPDNILVSNNSSKNNPEATVVICFSAAGQLTVVSSPTISNPPIVTIGSANSAGTFYLYDGSVDDSPVEFRINYYTGTVIEQ